MIDLQENIGRNISLTRRHMIVFMAKEMEPLGIGAGQYAFLFSLYLEDGQSQQQLSDKLLLDKAATGRAINKLVRLGYVNRIPDLKDKRSVQIFLTEKGQSIRPQLEAIVEELQAILLSGMNNEEQQFLNRLMKKMTNNIIEKVRSEKIS